MGRFFSTLTVLALMFLANLICVRQTLAFGDSLGNDVTMKLLAAEAVAGLLILAGAAWLVQKYAQGAGLTWPRPFEAVRQLRRLVSAVWS